jgi:predicted HTH transcriptional regulator
MTISQLAKELGLSTRAVEKQLAKLQQDQKLQRIGAAKGGHWQVNK